MHVLVIDAQGGGVGRQLIAGIKKLEEPVFVTAVGTNAVATGAMLAAGADEAATGENAVVVQCRQRDIDVILGPIGIAIADALLGEITPAMAVAVGQSQAKRILIPFDHCDTVIVGTQAVPVKKRLDAALEALVDMLHAGQ